MKNCPVYILLIFCLLHPSPGDCLAQSNTKPWWPHAQWGAGDQAGASNWITPEKIIKAMTLVKTGKMYEMGQVYEQGMPLSGNRTYKLVIPSFPTHGPIGTEKVVFNDEYISGEIGQVGTQFDGLGHVGMQMKMADGSTTEVFYNGFTREDMRSPYGLQKLGIEHLKPIITRGLMIDIAGLKKLPTVQDGLELTLAEVRAALAQQGIPESWIEPGDAILFNFGWWRNWPNTWVMNESRRPKIHKEVVQWLIDLKPGMVGSDAILDGSAFNVHTELTMKQGVFNLEWMSFEQMSEDKAYQFLFIFTPVRFKGATGSPGRPVGIR
jgi:kynurenine formamidase